MTAESTNDEPTAATVPSPAEPSPPGYLSPKQIRVVLGGLMAGMFLAALDRSIVGVALPTWTGGTWAPRRPG